MQAGKLRRGAAQTSFTPVGAYFKQIARDLRQANALEAKRQRELEHEDRLLETRYRRRAAKPAPGVELAL